MLFRLEELAKEFSGAWLFREITVQCNDGDRIGLIGRNGVGKTTLFELIEEKLTPDGGRLIRSRSLEVSRVEQIPRNQDGSSLIQETLSVFEPLRQMEEDLRRLETRMAETGLDEELARQYEQLRTGFELKGGYGYRARTERVLFGLGFDADDLEMPCEHLSGGQRSRMALARALLRPANLLLLDEPTNHVDLQGILWLEQYLAELKGALVVVSHDRHFLDRVTNRTWEIEGGTLHDYPASYSASRGLRAGRRRLEEEAFEKQQEWKRRTEDFIRRNIAGQKTRQAQSRRKQLEKAEWIEGPEQGGSSIHIRIPEARRSGSLVVEIETGGIGYSNEVLIEGVTMAVHRGQRIGILGGNGTGKTTLLKSLLGQVPLVSGQVHWGQYYIPGYFAQEGRFEPDHRTAHDVLAGLNPGWTDEELRSFAALFGFRGEDVHREVQQLSGGERSRLSLARLFSFSCNALFLDEPTNHLDIDSREALEGALAEFGGALVVVSHDIAFLANTVNEFLLIRRGRLETLSSLDDLQGLLLEKSRAVRPTSEEKKIAERVSRPGLSKNERMRIEKRMNENEERIGALEKARAQVEEDLQSGSADHVHLQQLSARYQELERELEGLYRDWEELARQLETD
jgi:ATP-binding cassette subfamily F protein 3